MEINEKFYCGLDLSFSGSALIILNNNGDIINKTEISTKKDETNIYDIEIRMIQIKDEILSILEKFRKNIVLIYIEDISFGSKGLASDQLAALNYFIRINLLKEKFLPYYMVAPGQLKKFVSGSGSAKKQLMLKEVYKRWGIDFNSDNLCDAYSLARMGLDNYNKGVFEILKKVKAKRNKNI